MTLLTTKSGKLQGKTVEYNGVKYFAFHNIPYAEAPIGNLRFKAPQPVKPWSGILDSTKEGDECYSKHQFYLNKIGSEDCLKLNVYTPSINKKQSVMVFIHGGGFTSGSSKIELYGPDYFMKKDIVLVTINYRLGIFGFLALEDKSLGIPGNAGLKDQVEALKWIQANISYFGGDPDNVTLFGNSAGSASVNYLLCSAMSRGLFHKAIMQSGSALNPWTRGKGLPEQIAAYFNNTNNDESKILEILMGCTKEELLKVQSHCHGARGASELEPFCPVVEGTNPYESSFLLEEPFKLMKQGNYIKVPMIIGYNTHEGLLWDTMEVKYNTELIVKDFKECIPWFYKTHSSEDLATQIKKFYFGKNDPISREHRHQFCDMQTDIYFLRGIYVSLQLMLQSNTCPIYFYRFDFDGQLNGFKHVFRVARDGTCHGDELFYMFKSVFVPEIEANSLESEIRSNFVNMWVNFAKTGDPNPIEVDMNLKWPVTDGKILLNIGKKIEFKSFPEEERMLFWDKIFQ